MIFYFCVDFFAKGKKGVTLPQPLGPNFGREITILVWGKIASKHFWQKYCTCILWNKATRTIIVERERRPNWESCWKLWIKQLQLFLPETLEMHKLKLTTDLPWKTWSLQTTSDINDIWRRVRQNSMRKKIFCVFLGHLIFHVIVILKLSPKKS